MASRTHPNQCSVRIAAKLGVASVRWVPRALSQPCPGCVCGGTPLAIDEVSLPPWRVFVRPAIICSPMRTLRRMAIVLTAPLGVWLSGAVALAEARPPRKGLVGWASWYGSFHHGKPTANGERFSMYRPTAAHRTLPLGTTVAVTNLQTRRQVMVRINDRGPSVDPGCRIIDLSRAANSFVALRASRPASPAASIGRLACARPSVRRS